MTGQQLHRGWRLFAAADFGGLASSTVVRQAPRRSSSPREEQVMQNAVEPP